MDQQFSEKENLEKHQVDYNTAFELGNVPVKGMNFGSEQDAYDYYNSYARAVGFSIRRHYKYIREKDKKLVYRILCCSCQGTREKHSNGTPNKPRLQTRFNCEARMKIELAENSEHYVVTDLVAHHTHVLAPPDKAYMLRSHRCVRPAQEGLINSMTDAGIGPSEIFHYSAEEAGGYEKLNFSRADLDNIVQKRRKEFLKKGDGLLLLDYFKQKKKENDSFYYDIQVDDNNQIRNCFWCDAKSRIDYECFGDVVSFDTTYKTNDYDMPFAPFVGVNHHRQTIIFASALLSDETTETFVWVFEQFLHVMGGKAMKTIFSDQAMAIVNAIKQVFPDTHHRLCIWHIYQNALRNLSHVFTKFKSFNDDFMRCIYEAEAEEEFLKHWRELIEKYNLKDDKWMQTLFEKKEKWAQVYGRQHFCAGMASTQRSESMNNYFKKYFKRKQILREFMKQFDKAISLRRLKEAEADLKSSQSVPNLLSKWVVERLARDFYPRKMFFRFQEELNSFVDLGANNPPDSDDSPIVTYDVVSYNTGRVRRVDFIRSENTVKCSCQMFEFTGMPCAHMLKVWRMNNVKDVPSQYFLTRWSKAANPNVIIDSSGNTMEVDRNVPLSERLSELSHMAQTLVTIGSLTDALTEVAKRALQRAIEEVKACRKTLQEDVDEPTDANNEDPSFVVQGSGVDQLDDTIILLAPPRKKSKGEQSGRIKGFYDKMKKNKTRQRRTTTEDPTDIVENGEIEGNSQATKPQRRKRGAGKKGSEDLAEIEGNCPAAKPQPRKRAKKGPEDLAEIEGNNQTTKSQPRKRGAGRKGKENDANKVDNCVEKISLERPSIQNVETNDVENLLEPPYTLAPTHSRLDRRFEDDNGTTQVPFSFQQFLADQCAIPLDNGEARVLFSNPQYQMLHGASSLASVVPYSNSYVNPQAFTGLMPQQGFGYIAQPTQSSARGATARSLDFSNHVAFK